MNFRLDINGLRGIAILSVVLFHLNFAFFAGGYVGVDIFFVISGFLLTSIISKNIEEGKFSYKAFFATRLKRIFPSLIALVLLLTLAGYFFFTASDYDKLSKDALSALYFASNFILANRKYGYFYDSAMMDWLKHTWALSVEFQFYLLYPLFLIAAKKYKEGKYFNLSLVVLFFASLVFSIWFTNHNMNKSFYLLPSRIYEFVAGGLVFIYKDKFTNLKLLNYIGLLIIALSVYFYGDVRNFPSFYALMPVLGACLVIKDGKESVIFNNVIVQYIGKISYSLYLWHWPLVLIPNYFFIESTLGIKLLILAVSLLLAHISNKYIEDMFYKPRIKQSSGINVKYLYISLLIITLSFVVIHKFKGLNYRLPEIVKAVDGKFAYRDRAIIKKGCPDGAGCILGYKDAEPDLLYWGDSHAMATVKALVDLYEAKNKSLIIYRHSGCPPIEDQGVARGDDAAACGKLSSDVAEYLLNNKNIKKVVLASRWPQYLYGFNEYANKPEAADAKTLETRKREYQENIVKTMCDIVKTGREVYAVNGVPEMKSDVSKYIARNLMVGNTDVKYTIPYSEYIARFGFAHEALEQAKAQCGVHIIDVDKYLCDGKECYGYMNEKSLYADDDHLNIYGDDVIKPAFEEVVN